LLFCHQRALYGAIYSTDGTTGSGDKSLGKSFIGDIMVGASAAFVLVASTTFLLFCFGEASL
jgi:hypothetical protein